MAKYLLTVPGVDVNLTNLANWAALHVAVSNNNIEMVHTLTNKLASNLEIENLEEEPVNILASRKQDILRSISSTRKSRQEEFLKQCRTFDRNR